MDLYVTSIGSALFFVFLSWHYALRCGFISDDHAVLAQRKDIIPDAEKHPKKEDVIIKIFNDGVIMYYLNWFMRKAGLSKKPLAWHTLCLGLHLVNVYLVYKVMIMIGMPRYPAVITGFIWGINPMLNQNVVWISGRPYVIATTLALICMLFWNHPIIVLPLYMLGVITNISVAFLPLILKAFFPEAWQINLYIICMLGGGIPFILWKFHQRFTGALVLDRDNFRFKIRRFNAVARVYAYYVWALIVPVKMGWYHQAGFKYNPKWEKVNIWTTISYGIVAGLIALGAPGAWFILGILPNANIFSTNSFLQDRYVYFGSIGLAMIVAPLLVIFPELVIVIGTFYGVRAYMYSRQLKDDESMYRENWKNHPKSDYAVNNLSFFFIQQKRFEEARVIIMRGIAINPHNKMLWYNLGITWASTGNLSSDEGKFRFLRAVDCWKRALAIEPRWRKPADDLKKMVEFLLKNKVISMNKGEGANQVAIDIPMFGGKK